MTRFISEFSNIRRRPFWRRDWETDEAFFSCPMALDPATPSQCSAFWLRTTFQSLPCHYMFLAASVFSRYSRWGSEFVILRPWRMSNKTQEQNSREKIKACTGASSHGRTAWAWDVQNYSTLKVTRMIPLNLNSLNMISKFEGQYLILLYICKSKAIPVTGRGVL
jgi:hypothetical protein